MFIYSPIVRIIKLKNNSHIICGLMYQKSKAILDYPYQVKVIDKMSEDGEVVEAGIVFKKWLILTDQTKVSISKNEILTVYTPDEFTIKLYEKVRAMESRIFDENEISMFASEYAEELGITGSSIPDSGSKIKKGTTGNDSSASSTKE